MNTCNNNEVLVFFWTIAFDVQMFQNSQIIIIIIYIYSHKLKCWNPLKPVLGGMEYSLHLPLPTMNRLNQTEPSTFSILTLWSFRMGYIFHIFSKHVYNFKYILTITIFFKQNHKNSQHVLLSCCATLKLSKMPVIYILKH